MPSIPVSTRAFLTASNLPGCTIASNFVISSPRSFYKSLRVVGCLGLNNSKRRFLRPSFPAWPRRREAGTVLPELGLVGVRHSHPVHCGTRRGQNGFLGHATWGAEG